MPGYLPSGFEIGNAFDRRAYPTPRRNRTGPPPSSALGGDPSAPQPASYPQSRQMWFESSTANNSRSTAASERLRGPSIIKSVVWMQTGAINPGNRWLELGKALSPINEINVALTAPKAYTPLIEGPSTPQAVVPASFNGMWVTSPDAPNPFGEFSCHIIVPDRDWFLIFAVYDNNVGGLSCRGLVSLIDQVDPFALASYVG